MSRGIYRAYQKAGADFLGYRLAKLFVKIETPEDIALHNDVLSEVLQIIEGEERQFFKRLAEILLYKRVNKQKRFLFMIACLILNIGQKKG